MKNARKVDADNTRDFPRGNYHHVIEQIRAAGFCPFCEEHLLKFHPNPILFRTPHWLATENGWPYEGVRRQFLLLSRAHTERIETLPQNAWTDLQEVHARIVREYGLAGATLMIRSGETSFTGASVGHLHAHLVAGAPRTETQEPIKAVVGFKSK